MESSTQCNCQKWYEVIDANYLHTLLGKYLAHPVYGKDFTIHQPCFLCRNEDRTEGYAIDEFTASELFDKLPHPETLNKYFAGVFDDHRPMPPSDPSDPDEHMTPEDQQGIDNEDNP